MLGRWPHTDVIVTPHAIHATLCMQDAVGEDGMFAARSGVGQPMPADGTACAAGPAAAVGASAASALQPPAAPASPGSMQAHARPMMPPSPQVCAMDDASHMHACVRECVKRWLCMHAHTCLYKRANVSPALS